LPEWKQTLGINEGQSRGQPANQGPSRKIAIKMECVCVYSVLDPV